MKIALHTNLGTESPPMVLHSSARFIVTAFLCVMGTAGCGGNREAGSPPQPPGGTGSSAAPPAGSPSTNRCPLTADQVSAAVGAQVKGPDSSCSFFPADESKTWPSATFVKQNAMACSTTGRGQLDYKETVDGLGYPAYIHDGADGSWVLVCRGPDQFEMRVDMANQANSRAGAIALARLAAAAR